MNLPPLTYLSFDSLSEGIGFSQVFHYITRLAERGMQIELHTFEKEAPPDGTRLALERAGVTWIAHPFGRSGALGGLLRVLRGAWATRGAAILHARSDLAAASALLARQRRWIWDMRSFWREQRVALGMLQPNSVEARVLRWIEGHAARRSASIVVLADAAIPVLAERFGSAVGDKCHVVPTCTDLTMFTEALLPQMEPLRLLLAGTLNAYYDLPATLRLVERLRRITDVEVTVAAPGPTAWDDLLLDAGVHRTSVAPHEMPALIRDHHAGLSICRFDAGISLRAAMPTKVAEFLACGRPVVVNRGLGDADAILRRTGSGAVLESGSEEDLENAAQQLLELLRDEEIVQRCRAAAERFFSLDVAVDRLIDVYGSTSSS